MKKFSFLMAGICLTSFSFCQTPAQAADLILQAETAVVAAPMKVLTDPVTKARIIETAIPNAGAATFRFNISQAGTHDILLNVEAFGPDYDSLSVQIDGAAPVLKTFNQYNRYVRYKVATLHLNAGAHQVVVRGADRFTRLDYLVVAGVTGSPPPPPPPPPPLYTTPKVAAIDYSWSFDAGRQQALAKFDYIVIDKGRQNSARMHPFVNSIKAINPAIKVAHYEIHHELLCSKPRDAFLSSHNALIDMSNAADYWLRNANGTKVQWTGEYGACDMNLTSGGKRNAAGQTWSQYKWQEDRKSYFMNGSKLDYVLMDNTFISPRVDADFYNQRRNLSRWDVAADYRRTYMTYVTELRKTNPGLLVMGNTDNDLSSAEYAGKLNGAYLECMQGCSWSLVNTIGWKGALDYYHRAVRNTAAPKDVLWSVIGVGANYKMVRFNLATTMLDNGYFMYTESPNVNLPIWFDEYNAQVGAPLDGPVNTPYANGVYLRRYANGLVIVNPQNFAATITIPAGYKRIRGTQVPSINNGQVQGTVLTMPAQDGLILVKQ